MKNKNRNWLVFKYTRLKTNSTIFILIWLYNKVVISIKDNKLLVEVNILFILLEFYNMKYHLSKQSINLPIIENNITKVFLYQYIKILPKFNIYSFQIF